MPDLRNFRVDLTPCEENDILILVSDGVHDNLEPFQIGLSPSEVAIEDHPTWESVDPQRKAKIAADYSIFLLHNLLHAKQNGNLESPIFTSEECKNWKMPPLGIFRNDSDHVDELLNSDHISCYKIVQRLINHCLSTNQNAADFIQEFPNKKLPKDYQKYPGKMDHTTCLCVRVKIPEKLKKREKKEKGEKEEISYDEKSENINLRARTRFSKRKYSSSHDQFEFVCDTKRSEGLFSKINESTDQLFSLVKRTNSNSTSKKYIRSTRSKKKPKMLPVELRRSRSLESIPVTLNASSRTGTRKRKNH